MPSTPNPSRVTQRDVARAAGVDVSTVSLCLNNHPRIPESTRSRVLQLATEMGYRRDPALSAIAASRWSRDRDNTGLVIAFVVDDLAGSEIELRLYLDGVRTQAGFLGYQIEVLELTKYPGVESLNRVVRSRGIRGMITGQSRIELPPALFTQSEIPVVHCGYLRDVPGDINLLEIKLRHQPLADQAFRQNLLVVPRLLPG